MNELFGGPPSSFALAELDPSGHSEPEALTLRAKIALNDRIDKMVGRLPKLALPS